MKIIPRASVVTKRPVTASADTIALDYDTRCKRRVVLTARGGLRFLVDLAASQPVQAGDAYHLDDGRNVVVEAAPEELMQLTCSGPMHLARLAWHIGNRHLAAQVGDNHLRIRADHVIADMARGLGAAVAVTYAPFEPERGAYHEH